MSGAVKSFDMWRTRITMSLKATPDRIIDHIPSGYPNNIRWNAGHILANFYEKMEPLSKENQRLDPLYNDLFLNGTSPHDWDFDQVPSLDILIEELEKQNDWVQRNAGTLVTARLETPFRSMETGEELLQLLTGHDCIHLGIINGIKYASGISNVWKPEH
ncbi:DinB family protein [Bacillus sp. H-16]|uniref:DinB family protein n=1 Tax=Alteribacter salitolerans TaxID=2912333 RepID=UPI001964E0C8|nr:DinB family protein [Alteribacter salitolerans]MBM7094483.1 DinB family protein [Alteribacter salitolerans]